MNKLVRPLLVVGAVLLGQVEATPGGEAELGARALEVRRLIRQLDSPQLRQREEAEQKLIDLGPPILDLLPRAGDPASAEVRQRVGRIRQTLERALAESVVRCSRVTLAGDALRLATVLAALEEQTGNKIIDRRGQRGPAEVADQPLHVAFDQTPFWQALDQVLDQAALSVDLYGAEKAVYVRQRPATELAARGRVSYAGPFRFEPVRIEAVRDLRSPVGEVLRLVLEVAWEPRLSPISLGQQMADVEALDDRGNPLPVDNRRAKLEVPISPGEVAKQLTVPLALPARDVTRISRLKGRLLVLLPGKMETFRFQNLAAAEDVEQRIAGATVVLQQVRKNNAIWEVDVRVRFDQAGGALASHRNWIYENRAYLEGPDGTQISYDGFETNRRTEDEVGIGYFFALDGPLTDHVFVYQTPGLILSAEVEYEIRDVTLP